jgi:hypothetical protein
MTHDPDVNAAHGRPVAPPEQRNWGPGGPSAKSAERRPVGAPGDVKIRRWSPVVLARGTAGSFWVFVVVVPGKTLVP